MTEKTPIQKFYERGLEFIARAKQSGTDPCVAMQPGTDEWNSWATYFRLSCGALPAVMFQVERGILASMTVPAQWPEWFDETYRAPDFIPPRENPWKPIPVAQRLAGYERVMKRIAQEPLPSDRWPNGNYRYPPKDSRIINRFEAAHAEAKKERAPKAPAPASLEASPHLAERYTRRDEDAA